MMNVTAIFDIGKTNKKFFVFDENFNEVDRSYIRFDEIEDDDGFPSENLSELVKWVKGEFDKLLNNPDYNVQSLNFSTYGASMVHLDWKNEVVVPFYNYLKPFPDELKAKFEEAHGSIEAFELNTSSPFMGFLNSGLQLFYLKHSKPELLSKVVRSVHFPQYLSSLFTGEYYADYTSLGCHTGLWDSGNNRYADWVKKEGLEPLLDPVVNTTKSTLVKFGDKSVRVGVGVHDSSAAIIPYLNANDEEFALISTGTWSICMNLYNHQPLTKQELEKDCLSFLGSTGLSTKASRLFLGKHLSEVARKLSEHFNVDYQSYKSLKWKNDFQSKRKNGKELLFDHSLVKPERFGFVNNDNPDYTVFDGYEDALYHLFDELTDLQIESLNLVISKSDVKKIYIDGGFSASEVFVQFLANKLPQYELYSSTFPLGSALGAAMSVNHRKLSPDFLVKNYNVTLHQPKK